MKDMNILFLGGAKRVSMARHFIESGKKMGINVNIFSYELTETVPIALIGKVINGLRYKDPDIYDHLHAVCQQYNISVVVPFIDGMVEVAHRFAEKEQGAVFAPTCKVAPIMFDKVECAKLFEAKAIPAPKTYCPGTTPTFPLIAKPRLGSASKGILLLDTQEDIAGLEFDKYLIQERFDNRQELTIDCYAPVLSASTEITACVPRIRNEVAGGEVTRTTVIHLEQATTLAKRTITELGLRGAITVQLIHDLDTGRLLVMEINPRLGGGAVAAVCAGVDIPGMIISEACGNLAQPCHDWDDLIVTRYQEEVVFHTKDT